MERPNMKELNNALRGCYPLSHMEELGFQKVNCEYWSEEVFFGHEMFVVWDRENKLITCYTKGNWLKQLDKNTDEGDSE